MTNVGVFGKAFTPHSAEWRDWRRNGIGGSDAPIITGDDPWRSALTLWLIKTGHLEQNDGDDEPQSWGRLLERAVIERFEQDSGLFVAHRQLCIEHHLDSWRRATIDGLVCETQRIPMPERIGSPVAGVLTFDGVPQELDRFRSGGYDRAAGHHLAEIPGAVLGLFEGKTTSKTRDWSEGPPAYVQIQVQHNLDVAELEHAWVAVLLTAPVLHFKLFEIERDERITGPLRALEAAFWQRVQNGAPPPAESSDLEALRQAYAAAVADTIELGPDSRELIVELEEARREHRYAERRVEAVEAELARRLQVHEVGTIDGLPAIEWRRHERAYFDVDALRLAKPAIAEKFTSLRGYRKFTIPKRGKHQEDEDVDDQSRR